MKNYKGEHRKEVVIRDYMACDHEQVLQLHRIALEKVGAYQGENHLTQDLNQIENYYQLRDGAFLVAEFSGRIIAMGAFRKIDAHTAEIKRMRTLPELQGLGIGTVMLQCLLVRIKAAHYRRVILETSKVQVAAQKLYTKNGFRPYKRERILKLDCTWFEKIL